MSATADYVTRLRERQRLRWPRGIARELRYPHGEIPITGYLRRWAALQPDKPALIFDNGTLDYRTLDDLSGRFARALGAMGVGLGDRVATMLPNCPQFVISFYAVLRLGAVFVPVSPMLKAMELEHELKDCGARVLLMADDLAPLLESVRALGEPVEVLTTRPGDFGPGPAAAGRTDFWRLLQQSAPSTIDEGALDAAAALNYTGGTTGLPKGCIHTQRHMIYTAAATCSVGLDFGQGDISLCFYPVFWIAGEDLACIFPIFAGATGVVLSRWDPLAFVRAVERHKVSHASLLVDNVVAILDHPQAADFDLRSLRTVRVSSFVRKLNREIRERWRALTGSTLVEATWGMTETHTCDTFTRGMQDDDMDLRSRPVFVGFPQPGTDIKICDFDTGAVVADDVEGEICIRSPSVMTGYWNAPEATAQVLKDGWLRSGDIGLLDSQGYLHYLGRRKEMLKVNGMSVFPAELEVLFGQHPAICASAVLGRPDEEKGERPVAFVQLFPGAEETAESLRAWCRDRIASYKLPEFRILDALPMTATGKVRKEDLRALL
jgi:fatty-acyl-CoA synthase/long-chain acyl-CoA synthetase